MDFNAGARNKYEDPITVYSEKLCGEKLIGGQHLIP